jgi:hypothetical protein
MKHCYLIMFSCLFTAAIFAQAGSAVAKKDSLKKDSLPVKPDLLLIKDSTAVLDQPALQTDSLQLIDSLRALQPPDSLQEKQVIKASAIDFTKEGEKKSFTGKELLFYYLVFLFLLFGLQRRAFEKYFSDLFRVFFRTTLKQKQVREQLLQSPLPSIFMNGFFVLSAGLYINFLLWHYQVAVTKNFWLQYLWCAGGLSIIYFAKFIGLKITGWLFNLKEATDSYIFIVFIINKMLGIMLLPFLLLLAFAREPLYSGVLVLSWVAIALLLIYRFILSYQAVRKEVKLNSFHFILYVFAFELIPLLLIYKLLMVIF